MHYRRNGEFGFLAPLPTAGARSDDPLLAGSPSRRPLMQWHDDSFDLPPGAVPLLDGEPCRWQAFRMGRGVWAFQGHFEVTRENAEAWGELRAAWRREPDAPRRVGPTWPRGWPVTEAFGREWRDAGCALCAAASIDGLTFWLRLPASRISFGWQGAPAACRLRPECSDAFGFPSAPFAPACAATACGGLRQRQRSPAQAPHRLRGRPVGSIDREPWSAAGNCRELNPYPGAARAQHQDDLQRRWQLRQPGSDGWATSDCP